MADLTAIQTFTRKWTRLRGWAAENKIPNIALIPVYHMDVQRLKTGYPMSEGELYRAVLGSAGMETKASLPTTTSTPSDILGNVKNTLWHLFTGLTPSSLVTNMYDSIKNTIEHPLTMMEGLFGTKAARQRSLSRPTFLADMIPGALDLMKLETGWKGVDTLVEHPVMALIDTNAMSGIAKIGLGAMGIDTASMIASKTGLSADELASESLTRQLGKYITAQHLPNSPMGLLKDANGIPILDDDGNPQFAQESIHQTLARWMRQWGVGHTAKEAMGEVLTTGQKYTKIFSTQMSQLDEFMRDSMTPELRNQMLTLLKNSGKTINQLINTDSVPFEIKHALEAWQPIKDTILEREMESGNVFQLPLPTGKGAGVWSKTQGPTIQRRINAVNDALDKFNERRQEAADVDSKGQLLDAQISQIMTKLTTAQKQVHDAIKSTIPDTKGDLRTALRGALTSDSRWDLTKISARKLVRNKAFTADPEEAALMRQFGLPMETESKGILWHEKVPLNKSHVTILQDMFKSGGIVDQLRLANQVHDFEKFRDLALKASRRMTGKFASEITLTDNPNLFIQLTSDIQSLYEMAKERKSLADEFRQIYTGITAKGRKVSVVTLAKKYQQAQEEWERAVIDHPPDAYQSMYLKLYTAKMVEKLGDGDTLARAKRELANKGFTNIVDNLNTDPRPFMEMLSLFSNTIYDDPLLGDDLRDVAKQVQNSAKKELAEMRAQGFRPEYVPNVTWHDIQGKDYGSYNIFVGSPKVPTVSHAMERAFDYTSSVYNFMAGVHKAEKEMLTRDGTIEYHENFVLPRTYKYADIQKLITTVKTFRDQLDAVSNESRQAVMDRIIQTQLGLLKYNPEELFGMSVARMSPAKAEERLIPKDLANIVNSVTQKGQLPMKTLLDKGTRLFKFSILGMSPRFTLHIAIGGSYLLAGGLDNPLDMIKYMGHAYKLVRDHTLDDKVVSDIATQEGAENVAFNYMGGRTGARMAAEEWLGKHGINPKLAAPVDWMTALGNLNFRFTRFVSNMQRAIAYLSGASKVGDLNFVDDPELGYRVEVSNERAVYEGLKSVHRVMGDLRYMSPFEKNMVTKILPFWGWTKHVLTYVMEMPVDHPIRAQILANLAYSSSNDVTPLLPLRIQLLLFLGSPTKEGTVTEITDRFTNPLRTVANYASLSGWISGLNPIMAAPFTAISKSITYGENTLYPQETFTRVFGIAEGKPSGSLLSMVEGVIPQLTALDVAFGLSNQYRGLAKRTPAEFKKDIYEALNIPFLNVQHTNLRALRARDEADEYEVAKAAAQTASLTGTFGQLAGYKTVPWPINPVYNISVPELESMYQKSMAEYGLPATETERYVRSPAGL